MGFWIPKTRGFATQWKGFHALKNTLHTERAKGRIKDSAELRWEAGKGLYAKNSTWNKGENRLQDWFGSSDLKRDAKYLSARAEIAQSINLAYGFKHHMEHWIGDYVVEAVIKERLRYEVLKELELDKKEVLSEGDELRLANALKEREKSDICLRVQDLTAMETKLNAIMTKRRSNMECRPVQNRIAGGDEQVPGPLRPGAGGAKSGGVNNSARSDWGNASPDREPHQGPRFGIVRGLMDKATLVDETKLLIESVTFDLMANEQKLGKGGRPFIPDEASDRETNALIDEARSILRAAGMRTERLHGQKVEFLHGGLSTANIQRVEKKLKERLNAGFGAQPSQKGASTSYTHSLLHSVDLPRVTREGGGRLFDLSRDISGITRRLLEYDDKRDISANRENARPSYGGSMLERGDAVDYSSGIDDDAVPDHGGSRRVSDMERQALDDEVIDRSNALNLSDPVDNGAAGISGIADQQPANGIEAKSIQRIEAFSSEPNLSNCRAGIRSLEGVLADVRTKAGKLDNSLYNKLLNQYGKVIQEMSIAFDEGVLQIPREKTNIAFTFWGLFKATKNLYTDLQEEEQTETKVLQEAEQEARDYKALADEERQEFKPDQKAIMSFDANRRQEEDKANTVRTYLAPISRAKKSLHPLINSVHYLASALSDKNIREETSDGMKYVPDRQIKRFDRRSMMRAGIDPQNPGLSEYKELAEGSKHEVAAIDGYFTALKSVSTLYKSLEAEMEGLKGRDGLVDQFINGVDGALEKNAILMELFADADFRENADVTLGMSKHYIASVGDDLKDQRAALQDLHFKALMLRSAYALEDDREDGDEVITEISV